MAIEAGERTLIDKETGILLAPDTTVIVPEVLGALAYDILFDDEAAIEYGDAQGLALDEPGAEGIPVTELDDEPRGYLAIDIDSGYVVDAANLVLIDFDDELTDEELLTAAENGSVPVAPVGVRDIEGIPFESVSE
jgi:hypothetical protein